MRLIDVRHLGRERVIGCWSIGGVLIDPGPSSSLESLLEELGDEVPRAILLTHIHLDHAGGTGTLVRHWPEVEVHVHESGAPHLADPSRLLSSAERLYGDRMETLWGEVARVPEQSLRLLRGGESILGFRVAYTPGHASHHVSYLHEGTGRAFVGDVAAVRIPPSEFVLPPTPPPEIDLEAWERSLDAVAAWRPLSLGLTHFGAVEEPERHIDLVRARLREHAERARRVDAEEFERLLRRDVGEAADEETAAALRQAVPPEQQYPGLERYWRKRAETGR